MRPAHILAGLSTLVLTITSGCSILAPTSDPRPIVRGPLPVTTNGAISSTFLSFRPRGASTTAPGSLDLSVMSEYSSLFENGTGDNSTVVIDAELWRTGITARTGLSARTDLEVELPIVYASGGFADDLIEGWHSLLGLPDGGRDTRPNNEFAVHVDHNGERAYELQDDELGLGDIPITVTQRILDEADAGIALALRAGLELPTGSESKGFGNGGFDWGGGLLAESTLGRFTFTGAAYHVITAASSGFDHAGVDALDQTTVHGGLEFRWNDQASVDLGLRWSTPVTHDIDIMEIDGDVLDLDVGWVEDIGTSRLTLGFTEDLIAESGPDLTVFLGWSHSF
jgi:hypothetical protein